MAQTKTMDWKWIDLALTVMITSLVTGALGWVLGTFRKADKKTVEEMIKASEAQTNNRFSDVQKRLDYWEAQAGKFATRDMIDSLKMEMKNDLGRVEKGIDDLRTLIIDTIRDKK
jgi:hypothetical protein